MGFTARSTLDDVVKTANLCKLSKEKFEILTKATLCELLVHYIQESEASHDNLVSKINGNMSITFDSKLNTLSQMYNAKIKKLEEKMEEEFDKLKSHTVPNTLQGIDTVVSSEPTTKYSLLVKKQTDSTKSWSTIAEDLATDLHDIPVMKSTVTKNKEAFHVAFRRKEDRDKAMQVLEGKEFDLEAGSKTQSKLSPKMKILDLEYDKYSSKNGEDKNIAKERLCKAIKAKNERIRSMVNDQGMILEVIYIKEEDAGCGSAVIKVDPRIRNLILQNNRKIHLDMASLHVLDQIHLVQCYACQEYGHKRSSEHCKLINTEKSICLYCADEHKSKDCPIKRDFTKRKCHNCLTSSNSVFKRNATGHTSTSAECPIQQREVQTVVSRTAGLDPKNFIYEKSKPRNQNHLTIST
jgi:hypothetical protein